MVTPADTKLAIAPQQIDPETNRFRGLIYGAPKIGKTTFALSFPRPLIINTDEGLEGDALKSLSEAGGFEHRIEQGRADLQGLFYWVRDHRDDFDTIIFDSGDELVEQILWEITDEGIGGRTGSNSGALGQTFFDAVPEQAEYLAEQRVVKRILNDYRRLRKHMVITFGERRFPGETKMSFSTSPGLQKPLAHWANVIGRMIPAPADSEGMDGGPPFRKGQRLLLTGADSATSVAGSRFGALAPYVVEPTFDKVWSAIEAGR